MLYSNQMPVLHYYLELYNLALDNNGKAFKLVKTLFNSAGRKIVSTSKAITPKLNATVEIGNFNLSKLPTDNYTLEIALVDTISKKAQISTKRLYVYNPSVAKEAVSVGNYDFVGSEYSIMGEAECNKMLDQIKYIAAPDELEQIVKLDSYEGKKMFLFRFWVSRNNNASKGINESRLEFDKRLEYVTKNYTYKYKEGYKTDRGRVIIKYGLPDDIERHPAEPNTQPYEKWTFNNVDGEPYVIFVFGDISGFGNYVLLHSTKKDEAFDDNWIQRIQKY
jgi:GWxTD domain-containing protein